MGDFAKQAEAIIAPSLTLPQRVSLLMRGGAVVRSILGHAVAAKVEGDAVPLDAKARDYLLGRVPLDPAMQISAIAVAC